ncbi:MAG: beta-ketoacyl synthase N-terminal-like domain-containing protein [Bacteroidetes bacterium]|nr:beta-ketoacyl synthase N-terminal-like domain-containing protein [Bacteroidota bacterium]
MKTVYAISENIISSLGFTALENAESLLAGTTGIRINQDGNLSPQPVPLSLVDTARLEQKFEAILESYKKDQKPGYYTRLEKLLILSLADTLAGIPVKPENDKVILVLSTTKGNIDLLEDRFMAKFDHKRIYLWAVASVLRDFFGFANTPLIISNACISGVMALITASRLLRYGKYETAVVTGGDIASEFVISGFQSFQALSPEPCKPFDLHRTGLSLGEGCGTIVLSANINEDRKDRILVMGGSVSNDANHISGPSRTGEELSMAINKALEESGLEHPAIDYISAHGTATPYNDEMEAKAISLSKMNHVHVNSFKGYWGHTLGASGLMESAALILSMKANVLFKSAGFEVSGVSERINVVTETIHKPVNTCLKTASGFGGCNAALVFQKT